LHEHLESGKGANAHTFVSGMAEYTYTKPKTSMPKKISRIRGPMSAAIFGAKKLSKKFHSLKTFELD
jgi:hypothetical protein